MTHDNAYNTARAVRLTCGRIDRIVRAKAATVKPAEIHSLSLIHI